MDRFARWFSLWCGVLLLALAAPSCVVDTQPDGDVRELRGGLQSLELRAMEGESTTLRFSFGYLLGLIDEEGIAPVEWSVVLRTRDRQELGRLDQTMREPAPDATRALVVGERAREIPIPSRRLRPGEGYVLWLTFTYRGERLAEILAPVFAITGEQISDPFDPEAAL
jgi:hypothetical protein